MSNTFSILVIGETGCGKSTLINTITNYFLGGKIPDDIKVAIKTKFLKATEKFKSSENDSQDRTKSQTDSCNTYSFKKDSKTFAFIDTPGLSDTRGVKQDDLNIGKIIDSAENCSSLSAVIIVINGTVPRMTINLQNVITRLRGSIPDSLLKNVFLVFTNCLSHTRNFVLESLEIEVNTDNIFHMNNTAFSTDRKLWDEISIKSLKTEFELSFMTIERLLDSVSKVSSVSTKDFGEMKKHRMNIKSTLHKAKVDIGNLQKLQDSLASYQAQLEKANKDVESFKNFTKKTKVASNELKDAPYHSTICSTCNHVCHDRCGLHEITSKGDNAFINCTAMAGRNNCRICPSECSYTVHYHDKKTMVKVEKTVEEELKDLKEKFMKSSQLSTEFSGKINSLSDAKNLTNVTLKKMTTEIVSSCKELKKLCSGFNLVDELQITLSQMEMEAKNSTSFDARKSADEMIRVIRDICDTLSKESELKSKKKIISIDESKIKKDHIKKNNFVDDNEKEKSSKIQCDCFTCNETIEVEKKLYNSILEKKGTFECQKCLKSNNNSINNNNNKNTKTNSNKESNNETTIEKIKKLNCTSCKNEFLIPKEKLKQLINQGEPILCDICKSKKSNIPKQNDPNNDIKQKKLNCNSCKKDFYLDDEKFKELRIKYGNNIQCKKCFIPNSQKPSSADPNKIDEEKNKQKKKLSPQNDQKDKKIQKDKKDQKDIQ
ncbi:hypothetical protein DICPUDRAFT_150025 [Dictyostelium purpureum]|uniref:AIG1-type G domain-containing protein n=1 Tax=Dictyostelium purpureum TaxID=5786 RepID=F0ZF96_DICPU|nr:uncharacterized protein DICPUDRAFT_150025 [Dictyostelium purpureum]EGC37346.1 hypothetical protein DICPUDRAFT_150025 [Dictyostelium purpureum]|eukprot:XP_003286087.1 hypothetical protein DICPUDRAFT_150025 [Dictyostelium purpureum]